jgi:hypothetical protein
MLPPVERRHLLQAIYDFQRKRTTRELRVLDQIKACHGLQQRAIQVGTTLIRRADAPRLDGPVKQGHDNLAYT